MTVHTVQVRDAMERTKENLAVIDNLKSQGSKVWEVTQLVNSFAGIVLHPWEEWKDEFRAIRLDSAEGRKWPNIEPLDRDDDVVSTVADLIRLVRNAFAHGNIIFEADDEGEISALVIWNSDPEGYRTWSARLHVDVLHQFLDVMLEQASLLPEPRPRQMPTHKKHASRPVNPRCPTCGRAVKRGHPLYAELVSDKGQTAI